MLISFRNFFSKSHSHVSMIKLIMTWYCTQCNNRVCRSVGHNWDYNHGAVCLSQVTAFHLLVPDLQVSCSDLTRMRGYQDSSPCYGCQATCPIAKVEYTFSSYYELTKIPLSHPWGRAMEYLLQMLFIENWSCCNVITLYMVIIWWLCGP